MEQNRFQETLQFIIKNKITLQEIEIIYFLYEEPRQLGEIARGINKANSNVYSALGRLIKKGLIDKYKVEEKILYAFAIK